MQKIYLDSADSGSPRLTVQAIGSSLVARAMESLLAAEPGFAIVDSGAQVVLLIGAQGIKAAGSLRTRKARKGFDRFVLIADGSPTDYDLVRSMPINVFVAADDSLEVLREALQAAASGYAYCSPQMVRVLVDSTDKPIESRALPNTIYNRYTSTSQERSNEPPLELVDATEDARIVARSSNYGAIGQQSTAIVAGAARIAIALGLTEREWEVAALAVEGLMNAEICEKLSISIPTVKFLLYRTYQKLGIRRRAQLATALMIKPTEPTIFALHREYEAAKQTANFEMGVLAS